LVIAQAPEEIAASRQKAIQNADTIPENLGIKEMIGKKGLMWPRLYAKTHEAAELLQ
jgi:hypothetical protein